MMDDNPYRSPAADGRVFRFPKKNDHPIWSAFFSIVFFWRGASSFGYVWDHWDAEWGILAWAHAVTFPIAAAALAATVLSLLRHVAYR
jgi:hypothetical protein